MEAIHIKRGGYRRFLVKNTLAMALPMLVLLCVLVVLLSRIPISNRIKDNDIQPTETLYDELDRLYKAGDTNVVYNATDLRYSGYNYMIDGQIKAAYYYNIDKEGINFFLIKTSNPKEHIDEVLYKGQIVKDSILVEHILSNYSEMSDVNINILEGYVNPYIISEPDYPYVYIILVYVIVWLPMFIGLLIVSYTLLIFIIPSLHPQSRRLSIYGRPSEVIAQIDDELKDNLLFHKGNIYITNNYMIVNYITRTDVIKLDLVKYLSKNLVENNSHLNGGRDIYRLTFSNPEKLFFEVDCTSEDLADEIVENIL